MHRTEQQRGAVSLFVVIFAMLLITVVTVSFLRFMIQGEQQASDQDLSASALDSAQAGVQDAARALLRYETCLNSVSASQQSTCGDPTQWSNCNNIVLTQLYKDTYPSTIAEIPVQQTDLSQTDQSQSLNQAYTCVTTQLSTDNVLETASTDTSKIIPLQSNSNFTTIELDWFSRADLASSDTNYALTLQNNSSPLPLFQQYNSSNQTGWSPNTPSVMRVQLIQFSTTGGFKLSDFDNPTAGSDADTLFLYPTNDAPATTSFALDSHQAPTGTPVGASCQASLSAGGYACREIISLPTPVNDNGSGARTAYLRVTPLYNASHYSVTLLNGTSSNDTVQFYNVQPIVDSTGRANDVFQRVQVRADLFNDNLPFPTDAVDITGNFCKNFAVTNDASQYAAINITACKP